MRSGPDDVEVSAGGVLQNVFVAGDEGEAMLECRGHEEAVGWIAVDVAGKAGGFDKDLRAERKKSQGCLLLLPLR